MLLCHMRSSFSMPLLYHAYVYLEFLILACTIYILAPRPKLFCIERKQRYTLKIHFRKPIYPNTNDAKNLTERLYYGITGKEYKIYDNLITSQKKNVIVAQPEDWLLGLIQIYCPDLYITEESKLKEELGIDSLNMYEIACKIEERIHVDITNKLGEIVTVSDLRCLTYSENTLER